MDKNNVTNASFVLAGGACLLMIAGQVFSPHEGLHIRGFYLLNRIVVPLLSLWVGMLIRFCAGKPKWWGIIIVSIAMIASYIVCLFVPSTPYWLSERFQWYGILLLGILLPWEYLWENRDKSGIKSIVLFLLSTLAFCALDLVHDRMEVIKLPAPYEDLGTLLCSVSKLIAPIVLLLPVFFAAEFSLSDPGQWLGRQKWFKWITVIAAIIFFIASLFNIFGTWGGLFMRCLMMLAVQPFTIYLIIVICRILRKLRKKDMTWKEVFKL